jgi:hypothetical protein
MDGTELSEVADWELYRLEAQVFVVLTRMLAEHEEIAGRFGMLIL